MQYLKKYKKYTKFHLTTYDFFFHTGIQIVKKNKKQFKKTKRNKRNNKKNSIFLKKKPSLEIGSQESIS